eukprot:scaffold1352_cov129-Isochrysis_galbana.AAC.6
MAPAAMPAMEADEDHVSSEQPAIIYKGKKPYKMIGVYLMGDVRRRQHTAKRAALNPCTTELPRFRILLTACMVGARGCAG